MLRLNSHNKSPSIVNVASAVPVTDATVIAWLLPAAVPAACLHSTVVPLAHAVVPQ